MAKGSRKEKGTGFEPVPFLISDPGGGRIPSSCGGIGLRGAGNVWSARFRARWIVVGEREVAGPGIGVRGMPPWGIYQRMIAAYREPDRAEGRELMVELIGSVSAGVPGPHRDHHPGQHIEEARSRRTGLLRPGRHLQRPDRGDQRPAVGRRVRDVRRPVRDLVAGQHRRWRLTALPSVLLRTAGSPKRKTPAVS